MDVDIIREYITFNTIKEELNRADVFHITSSPIEIANAIGRGETTVRRYIDFYRKTKLL